MYLASCVTMCLLDVISGPVSLVQQFEFCRQNLVLVQALRLCGVSGGGGASMWWCLNWCNKNNNKGGCVVKFFSIKHFLTYGLSLNS